MVKTMKKKMLRFRLKEGTAGHEGVVYDAKKNPIITTTVDLIKVFGDNKFIKLKSKDVEESEDEEEEDEEVNEVQEDQEEEVSDNDEEEESKEEEKSKEVEEPVGTDVSRKFPLAQKLKIKIFQRGFLYYPYSMKGIKLAKGMKKDPMKSYLQEQAGEDEEEDDDEDEE